MTKFSEEFTIRGCDVNADYTIKPSVLCGYFQESFARYCTIKNVAAFDVILKDVLWVISDIHIEFTSQLPFWGEKIRTEVWCSEIKKLRLYLDFRIYSGQRLIAKGDSCWFIINSKTRRPEPVENIVTDFDVDREIVFENHKRETFEKTGNLVSEKLYKVGLSDLDFNYHVNNLAYVNVAVSNIDENYLATHFLKSYAVTYKKESFLHDEWICELYKHGDEYYHEFKRKSDGEILCIIKTIWQNKIPDKRDVRFANFDIKNCERKECCVV